MELKDRLLELRKKHGMTQDEMAEALLVSRQTVYKWETGRVQPDINRLKQICLLFHVSSDELLDIAIFDDTKTAEASIDGEGVAAEAGSIKPVQHMMKRPFGLLIVAAVLVLCGIFSVLLTRRPQEVKQSIALGIVPAELQSGLTQSVTEKELLALLSNVCEKETGSIAKALAKAAADATNEQMSREKAAYWLYCTHIWTKLDANADLSVKADPPQISQRNVYEELNTLSRSTVDGMGVPWEGSLCRELAEAETLFARYDGTTEMDEQINAILYGPYYTSVMFCLAQRSFMNEKPLMDCKDDAFRPKDKLTREEAIVSAYRLCGSW